MREVNLVDTTISFLHYTTIHYNTLIVQLRMLLKTCYMNPPPSLPPPNSIGVVVSSKKAAHGEIYAKWKRSSNRKVGREGDEEEASLKGTVSGGGGGWGSGGGRGRRGGWGEGAGGAWGSEEITGGGEGNGKAQGDGRVVRDELRNKDQIRKAKAKVCVCTVWCHAPFGRGRGYSYQQN